MDTSSDPPFFYLPALKIQFASKRTVMNNYTKYMDTLIANAKKPYPHNTQSPPLPWDPLNQLLVPVYEKAGIRFFSCETQNNLLLTAFALRAYKMDHGAYPASLQALTPAYLKTIPTDPFTAGKPLRYKQTGKSYLLFSVGPDGKDNDGKPCKEGKAGTTGSSTSLSNKGDIVAGVNLR